MELTVREKISFSWRLIFMIIGWAGLLFTLFVRIFILETEGSLLLAIIRPYRFYTMQTNLIVSIWLTLSVIFQKNEEMSKRINGPLKGAVLVYITVTFLIYAIFLVDLVPSLIWQQELTNISTHYVVPIGFIIGWAFDVGEKYDWISLAYWIIYPHVYLGFALVHGTITGDYLYPFFDIVANGIGGVLIWYAILVAIFCLLGSLYIGINRLIWKYRQAKTPLDIA